MRKVCKRLTREQRERGVIFASTLSTHRTEMEGDTTHEVFKGDSDSEEKIKRLKDDRFFNKSHFKYNIIREGGLDFDNPCSRIFQSKHGEYCICTLPYNHLSGHKGDKLNLPRWKIGLKMVGDNPDYIEEKIKAILKELKHERPDTAYLREKVKRIEAWLGEIDKFGGIKTPLPSIW